MANYQDYESGYPQKDKYDYQSSSGSSVGILVALGILAAIVLALIMLSGPSTVGIRDAGQTTPPAAAPADNNTLAPAADPAAPTEGTTQPAQ